MDEVAKAEMVNSLPGTEFYSGILIPGMVNAHCHLELSYMRNKIAPCEGFAAFAASMGRVRREATGEERTAAAPYWDARMWHDGVSAVGDICNGDSTFEIKSRSRIRYHNFIELFGLAATSAGAALKICAEARGAGLAATVTPHSIYSLNEVPFAEALGEADNSPVSIHFMESEAESELYCGEGALREWYTSQGWHTDFLHHRSPVQRIITSVPPGKDVLLIHNTFVGRSDVEALCRHFGPRLTMVLCPSSNLYISSSLPPAAMLRDSGVNIAIGTDSLASNTTLSMVHEMIILQQHCGIALDDLLRWATANGARALGIGDTHGSIEPGRRPGIVLLEGIDHYNFALTPLSRTRNILYSQL